MDISLVNITSKNTYGGKLVNRLSTVGIYSLIACLEKEGIGVDFREYFLDFERSPFQELEEGVSFFSDSAKIIGVGCHSIHLPFAVRMAQKIKKIFPEKKIVLGGVGPSIVARQLMEAIPEIDAVAVGEAEHSLVLLAHKWLRCDDDLADIKGIVFRNKGRIIVTPAAERIDNLDRLPVPAYKYLDTAIYKQPMVMSARGCPFGCPFCSLGAYWQDRVVYRSPQRLLEELRVLEGLGVNKVFFADSCFMLDKKRLRSFIGAINGRIKMEELKTYGRLDLLDEEACAMLADANFKVIFYGLESGSDAVLKRVKGGVTVARGLHTVKMTQKYFSRIEVSLMWGFPFETLDDFRRTLDIHNYLKYELGCVVQLTWFQPFANTRYFKEYKDTLRMPGQLSAIYDKSKGAEQLRSTFKHAGEYDYTISIRSMIGHAHMYSLARELIDAHPLIFTDFYRYQTPDLERKVELARAIIPS